MMRRFLTGAAAMIALSAALAVEANAQDGCGWGYDAGYGYLYNSLRYEVPHFAAFPPVYYSYPVPRTYGYSPFAYPPHVMTPDVIVEPQPVTIINPHVESNKLQPSKPASDRSAAKSTPSEPLVILNPYVNQNMVARSN